MSDNYAMGGATPQTPQILEEMATLSENTDILLKLMAELEQRLKNVLRPEPNENRPDEVRPAEQPHSPHAQSLRSRNYQLHLVNRRLGSILQRLEI
jgi:hypothetical protein